LFTDLDARFRTDPTQNGFRQARPHYHPAVLVGSIDDLTRTVDLRQQRTIGGW
jgi:hypothetical protein